MTKILVIDDNRNNLVVLTALLSDAFPEVHIIKAESGFEGIEKAHSENPDIIILDLVMPLMDGIETCKRLKDDRFLKRIPVIMLSAYHPDSIIRTNALESGVEAFLSKPVDAAELSAHVSSIIRLKKLENQILLEKNQLEEKVKIRTRELLNELEKRELLEAALRESEERYRALFDRSLDSIFILDFKGRFIDANDAALKLFGLVGENIHNVLFASLLFEDQLSLATKTMREIQESGIQKELTEYKLRLGNGEEIFIEAQGSAILSKGKYTAIQLMARNITERKKMIASLEEAKEKAEAGNRLKSAFIYNISHEVRTPLNGILGFSSLIMQPDITDEDKEQYHSYIKTSSNRLISTITNFMDISLIASGNMEMKLMYFNPDGIFDLLFEKFQPLCNVLHLDLQLEIPKNTKDITLFSDPELFQKALIHLMDNALKFTRMGVITFGYKIKSGLLECFVKDTGTGISKEAQKRIFENFVQEEVSGTRGYEGSGLGLSIARGVIRLLGSEINLESDIQSDTVFSFTMPYLEIEYSSIAEEKTNRFSIL